MSYVDDNLSKNEKVLFRAHVSKAVFIPSIFAAILAILFFFYTINKNAALGSAQSGTGIMILFALFLALWSILLGIQAVITLATTEFAVTNRRVIAKTGFIRRRTVEILLMKVESVSINQPILGRIFDFGTVAITGTGGTREGFKVIAEPLEVRKKVNHILESYMHAYSTYQQSKAAEQNQA